MSAMKGRGAAVRRKKKRKRRGVPRAAPLEVSQILAWADEFHARTGKWPRRNTRGTIPGSLGETWCKIDGALIWGLRGLGIRSSLAKLLQEHRGVRNQKDLPRLTLRQILAWADEHHERTGQWPDGEMGEVPGSGGEKWVNVDAALRHGLRGLRGHSSLAQLLARRRGVPNPADRPPLTLETVLAWADAFHARTGRWPTRADGVIPRSRGERWSAVNTALSDGLRGLPGGSSLARLLDEHRGVRNRAAPPDLSEDQILAWAKAHKARTGHWPTTESGKVVDAPGETWVAINSALRRGHRSLPGGSSLTELRSRRLGVRNYWHRPDLTEEQVLAWAQAHQARTGRWPTASSGPVEETPEDTWKQVDTWLRKGQCGLPGGSSLARLRARLLCGDRPAG
jgi:hypothetical protein